MKYPLSLTVVIAMFAVLLLGGVADATGPTFNPANGNYYETVETTGKPTWDWARLQAEDRTFQQCPGHLVTVTSAEEDAFLFTTFGADLFGKYYGGFQDPGVVPPDAGWQWITGEPWDYTNWYPGEPNDAFPWPASEQHLEGFHNGQWNDADPSPWTTPTGYLVEYECPNQPPQCSQAAPSLTSIWPPNHRFVSVEILGVTDPDNDSVSITIDSIYQDEPVDNTGDGAHAPDGQGVGTSTAQIRAERDGAGNGRVYHIEFSADDGQGGACADRVLVSVPKNKGKKGAPIDDGAFYDSTTSFS